MIIYKKEVITLHRFLVLHIRISESLSNQFSSLTQFLNSTTSYKCLNCLCRSVTASCTAGSNLWPSVWLNTAQVNVTNQTTKSLSGLCLRRRHRIFKTATSACQACRLFLRGPGTRARGSFSIVCVSFYSCFSSPNGDFDSCRCHV